MDITSELLRLADMGQSSLWEQMEFFGLPLMEDTEYYEEALVPLALISLDTPPMVET